MLYDLVSTKATSTELCCPRVTLESRWYVKWLLSLKTVPEKDRANMISRPPSILKGIREPQTLRSVPRQCATFTTLDENIFWCLEFKKNLFQGI